MTTGEKAGFSAFNQGEVDIAARRQYGSSDLPRLARYLLGERYTPEDQERTTVKVGNFLLRKAGIGTGDKIADVGCGDATLDLHLADAFRELYQTYPEIYATTIDIADTHRTQATAAEMGLSNLHFVHADARHLTEFGIVGLEPGTFKAVVCKDALYHMNNNKLALEQIHALLEPGGVAVITTRSPGHQQELWDNLELIADQLRKIGVRAMEDKKFAKEYGIKLRRDNLHKVYPPKNFYTSFSAPKAEMMLSELFEIEKHVPNYYMLELPTDNEEVWQETMRAVSEALFSFNSVFTEIPPSKDSTGLRHVRKSHMQLAMDMIELEKKLRQEVEDIGRAIHKSPSNVDKASYLYVSNLEDIFIVRKPK